MPNATIRTLINELATVPLDTTAADTYQDETFLEIARLSRGNDVVLNTNAAFVAALSGVAIYSLPATARQALMVVYDDTQLAAARYDEAHYFDPAWRSTPGRPVAVMNDTIDRTKFAIIPPPREDGGNFGVDTPLSFTTWTQGNFSVVFTYNDNTLAGPNVVDVYPAIAFDVISKELGRDSDHMDPDLANAARQMADIFWRLSFPQDV